MTMSVCQYRRGCQPDARAAATVGRRPDLCAVFWWPENRLLIDPDTMWQITVGQWISDHRAVPETDVYSFNHARPALDFDAVAGAGALPPRPMRYRAGGGPVVLAATAIARDVSACSRDFLSRRLSESTTLVFIAAALALTVPHLLARPHVLALPVMVAWVGGLIAAADRRGATVLLAFCR